MTASTRLPPQRRSTSTWWPERKTQQDGESHRNKDFPPEVERRNGNDGDGQGPQTRRRGAGGMDVHRVRGVGGSGSVGHGSGLPAEFVYRGRLMISQ